MVGARPTATGADAQRPIDADALSGVLAEATSAATSPVDALEPVLRHILHASRAVAGAISLYDPRHELLRLAAESGLSEEGCRRLRKVRRGDLASWDMPLHSLMNRRAYLIASAATNRYVPPLIEENEAVGTIACVPLLAGQTPVGSLILVTRAPHALSENDVRTLEKPLRQLVALTGAIRRQATEGAPSSQPAARRPPSQLPPRAEVRARIPVRNGAAPAREDGDESDRRSLEQHVAGLEAEVGRLRARLAEAEAGAAHEQSAREQLEAALERGASGVHRELRVALETARRAEAARAMLAADHTRLAAELEELRTGSPNAHAPAHAHGEIDSLRARLAEAEAGAAHEQRVREQLEVALSNATTNKQELRQAREAARHAEAARSALAAEKARLLSEVESLRRTSRGADRADELVAETDRLRARLAEAEAGAAHEQRAREELEAALQRGTSAGQEELREALDAARAAEAERRALTAENAWLTAEIGRIRDAAHDDAPVAELEAEVDRLRARLAEAEAGAAHEQRAREELEVAFERGVSAGQDELRQAREAARRAGAAHAALTAEHAELRGRLSELTARADQVEALQAALAASETERASLLDARAQSEELRARLVERERALEEMRAAQTADAGAAATLVAQCDDLRATVAALEAERDRLAASAEGAAARRVHLEEALERGLAQARVRERELGERLGARERELEDVRSQWGIAVSAAAARVEALAADCKELRATLESLHAERERLVAAAEGAAAARAHLEKALEHGLEEARAREHELGERVGARERELEDVRSQWGAAVSAANARIEALATECSELRASVDRLEAERDRLTAEVEGAAAARARLEREIERAGEEAGSRARALAERLDVVQRDLETSRTERAEEAAAAAARMDGLAGECDQLRAAVGGLEAERDRLAAEVQGAAAARERLAEALQQALERARLREAEPSASVDAAPSAAGSPCPGRRLVVVDSDQSWSAVAPAGHEVITIPPSAALATALEPLLPARLVINLASPNALAAVAALRSADFPGRLWGCLADASSGHALPLGTIDLATRPLDPDAVLVSLARYVPSGTSVVTAGSDVDAFVSLRQTLARHGISVSMAWNARQAADLLPKLRPDVLLLDLDLPAEDCAGLLGHLGAWDPVPTVVFVAGSGDPAPSFAAAPSDPAHSRRTLSFGALLGRLAMAAD